MQRQNRPTKLPQQHDDDNGVVSSSGSRRERQRPINITTASWRGLLVVVVAGLWLWRCVEYVNWNASNGENVMVAATTTTTDASSSQEVALRPPPQALPGSQYTLAWKRPNGETNEAVSKLSKVTLSDLPDVITNSSTTTSTVSTNPSSSSTAGKEPILATLRAAGVTDIDPAVINLLPTWQQVLDLYGPTIPVVRGMDRCAEYRQAVKPSQRYLGVTGLYNTGTTALSIYLQANIALNESKIDWQEVMEDYKGEHMYEVPWGKHRLLSLKHEKIVEGAENLKKNHVLPVVIVRDPLTWFQSMCTSPYMARWPHTEQHCPNLVANEQDVARYPAALKLGKTVPVRLPKSQQEARFASLAHMYRDWYGQWMGTTVVPPSTSSSSVMPHLMVRLEDLIFRPDLVLDQIRQCVAGTWRSRSGGFVYLVGQSKHGHKYVKQQSSMISSMIKYGTHAGSGRARVRNMTRADMQTADETLAELMQAFQYRPAGRQEV